MWKTTASRLSAALLGYVTLIVLLLTLNPFYVSLPRELHISWTPKLGDALSNILLFLPIGFLYRLTGGSVRGALLTGAGVSLSIEMIQLFLPARTSSVIDLICNSSGAMLGALLHDAAAKRMAVTAGMVGRLRLETPLMGLVYLWLPLLWVNGLALGDASARWPLTALIGMCGAIVFAELWRQWLEPRTFRAMSYAALSTATWFLLGANLTGLRAAQTYLIALALTILSAALTAVPYKNVDRRFEVATLRRILPFFAFYLFLSVMPIPFESIADWHGMFGFTIRLTDTSVQRLYPRLEYLTAFTALGYLTAEWRGRSELPMSQDLPRVLILSAASAFLLEFIAGFQAGTGASLIRAVLAIASALLGGMIYHLLRDHIRFLLGR
jgi:VanZ family protein